MLVNVNLISSLLWQVLCMHIYCQENHRVFKYTKFSSNAYGSTSTAIPCIAERSDLFNAGVNQVTGTSNCTSLFRDEYATVGQSNIQNTISMFKETTRYVYLGSQTARSIFVPGNVADGAVFRYVINAIGSREFDLSIYNQDSTDRMLRMSVTATSTAFNTKTGTYGTAEYASNHAFTTAGVYVIEFVLEPNVIKIYVDGVLNHSYGERASSSLVQRTIFQGNGKCQILAAEIKLTEP